MARLTPRQRQVLDILAFYRGGFIRPRITPTGLHCFTLFDKQCNPMKNFTHKVVDRLIYKGVLRKKGSKYILPTPKKKESTA